MSEKKTHKWRQCPLGEHWVITHPMHTKSGKVTTRRGHCAKNPSKKDQIYTDELNYIADRYFEKLSGPPAKKALNYPQGNKFDKYIRGWCKYWNDIFKPEELLDPDLVKALIATESGFRATIIIKDGRGQGHATGLMQVTDTTQKILCDEKGELRDHLVNVDQKDLINPSLNIAAGIRWLFRKREIASSRLGRKPTWFETIMLYKGYKSLDVKPMKRLADLYGELKNE
ncbi:MAG: lytic transglycosylase domain-containing protein [Oligoflexia bacterium]|nr:lytic transglycosylase domain-containing protein [Oligoflexia bacterium]